MEQGDLTLEDLKPTSPANPQEHIESVALLSLALSFLIGNYLCVGASELSLDSSSSHHVPCLPRKVGPCRPSCSLICMAALFWRPLWLSTQHQGSQQCLSRMSRGPETLPAPRADVKHSLCSENPGLFYYHTA